METWWESLQPKDRVTAVIAIVGGLIAVYGAFLSTLNYRLARASKRQQFRVTLSQTFLMQQGRAPIPALNAKAVNTGERDARLTSFLLHVKGMKDHLFPTEFLYGELPADVPALHDFSLALHRERFLGEVRRLGYRGSVSMRALFTDATGKTYYSKFVEVEIPVADA